jgi:hypothetical protein
MDLSADACGVASLFEGWITLWNGELDSVRLAQLN